MPYMARIDPFAASPSRNPSGRLQSLFQDSSPDFDSAKYETNKLRPIGPSETMTPVMPQSSFRERSNRLRILEDDKNALIEDLIRQVEDDQHQLQQLRIEHDHEIKNRLSQEQEENMYKIELEHTRAIINRNVYVSVLIDGDSLMFSKDLLSQGERGGLETAQIISDALEAFATQNLSHLIDMSWKAHVKLVVNMKALGEVMLRFKIVDKMSTFENFLKGMLSSELVFDILDTSIIKGLTTKKVKDLYRYDLLNLHCHQVFLAALPNDDLNALLNEYPEIPLHERVTFWEGKSFSDKDKFNHEITSMSVGDLLVKLPTEGLNGKAPLTKVAAPMLARVASSSSTTTLNSNGRSSVTSTPALTWAAMTAQPIVPKLGENRSQTSTPVLKEVLLPTKNLIASVPKNKFGQRVDAVDESIPYQELQRIKKMKLCNIYYLKGKNECDGNCNHSHTYPLKGMERNILKEVARMTPCRNQLDCDDPACIYGHRCPQSKPGKKDCYYKDECRFMGWGHGIDDKVVKTHNIK